MAMSTRVSRHGAGRGDRILQHADIFVERADRPRPSRRRDITLTTKKSPITIEIDEDRAERDAAFRQRHDDVAHHVEPAGAGIERGLHHPLVDARHAN